jgi:parvulin-like peptidyl-prolyl isomerase
MRNLFTLVVAMFLLVVPACSPSSSGEGGQHAGKSPKAEKPAIGQARVTYFLAEVNGIPITKDEYLRYLDPYPDQMKTNAQGRLHVLQSLIDHVLMQGEAAKLGLDKDPDYLRKVENYRRNLLDNLLLEHVSQGGFVVTEEEARKYFKEHPDEFDRPERAQVSHILLKTEAEAKDALAKVRAGEPFEKLAREISLDAATRDRGGDMGSFSRKQRPQLADAAFALKNPGQISGPIQTSRGLEIIKLIKLIPPVKETFAQAREGLLSRLRARKRQEVKQQLLAKLREKASIKTDKQALGNLDVSHAQK